MSEDPELAAALRWLRFEESGQSTASLHRGDVVGDFVLDREIGRGSMGVVFSARQLSLDRTVALKVIPVEADAGRDDDRSEREARLLARIRHPNIVTVLAAGRIGGDRYVAMEWVDGHDLRHELLRPSAEANGDRTHLRQRIEWMTQIAHGLNAVHGAGVLHRDIKPSNILVDRGGRALLVDFGLARDQANLDATHTAGFAGTPLYASPEQFRGGVLTVQSDIFAFGVTLFEVIYGQPPFVASDPLRLAEAVRYGVPQRPGRRVAGDLVAIVEHCLEKRPEQRYRDAGALAADLERFLKFEPTLARRRGRIAQAWQRFLLRPRRVAFAAAAALLVGMVLVLASELMRRRSDLSRSRENATFATAKAAYDRGEFQQAVATIEEAGSACASTRLTSLLGDAQFAAGSSDRARRIFESSLEPFDRAVAGMLRNANSLLPPSDYATMEQQAGDLDIEARKCVWRAHWAKSRGDLAGALQRLDHAVALEPSSIVPRLRRAEALRASGRPADSIPDLEVARSLATDPGPDGVLLEVLVRLNRCADADALALALNVEFPSEPRILVLQSRAMAGLARYADAIAAAERAVRLRPTDPAIRRELMQRHIAAGMIDAAAADSEQITRDDASWGEICAADLAAAREDWPNAERLARQASESNPRSALALERLAQALRAQERLAEAIEVLDRLEALEPDLPQAAWQKGHLLLDLGRVEEAQHACERTLAMNSKHPESHSLHARLLLARGESEAAIIEMDIALGLAPSLAQSWYRLGDLWTSLDVPSTAIVYALGAAERSPRWFDAHVLVARNYAVLGHLEESKAAYETALALREHPATLADLAEVLDRLDLDRDALRAYQRAAELEPSLLSARGGEGILRVNSSDPTVRDLERGLLLLQSVRAQYRESPFFDEQIARAQARIAAEKQASQTKH